MEERERGVEKEDSSNNEVEPNKLLRVNSLSDGSKLIRSPFGLEWGF